MDVFVVQPPANDAIVRPTIACVSYRQFHITVMTSLCFSDVNDIDMFTGSMVEPPVNGAIVGPTIACVLSRQFHALKYGDRFYFEAFRGPNGFSEREY